MSRPHSSAHLKKVIEERRRQNTEETPQQYLVKKKQGREFVWSADVGEAICERIAGGELLTKILEEDDKPSFQGFFEMLKEDKNLHDKYSAARATSATVLVEKTLSDADAEKDPAMAALMRVKADARRWAASRFAPDLYGDVKRLEVSGEVRHAHALDLTQEQRARIAQEWIMAAQNQNEPALIEGTATTTGPLKPPRNQRPQTGAGGARRKLTKKQKDSD